MFEQIAKSLAIQVASREWTKDAGQFVPHAATWLNGKRSEDVIPSAGAGQLNAFTNLPQHTPDMYKESHDGRSNF
ncbi:hypothetical protein D3C77_573160 [compost metagenome]